MNLESFPAKVTTASISPRDCFSLPMLPENQPFCLPPLRHHRSLHPVPGKHERDGDYRQQGREQHGERRLFRPGLEQHGQGHGVAGKRDNGEDEHDPVQVAVQQPEKSSVEPDDQGDQRRPEQVFDGQRQCEEPAVDAAALVRDSLTLAVQVRGRLRGTIEVPEAADKAGIEAMALAEPNVLKFIDGQAVKKVVVVPGKIVNIVAG